MQHTHVTTDGPRLSYDNSVQHTILGHWNPITSKHAINDPMRAVEIRMPISLILVISRGVTGMGQQTEENASVHPFNKDAVFLSAIWPNPNTMKINGKFSTPITFD
jgi:hypothetical protein